MHLTIRNDNDELSKVRAFPTRYLLYSSGSSCLGSVCADAAYSLSLSRASHYLLYSQSFVFGFRAFFVLAPIPRARPQRHCSTDPPSPNILPMLSLSR
jgi:hypothetical protein